MKNTRISALLLERYHIGEVSLEEKKLIEDALENDNILKENLANLDRSDRDFFMRFPKEKIFPADNLHSKQRMNFQGSLHRLKRIKPLVFGLSAAALVTIIFLPIYHFNNSGKVELSERIKGVGTVNESLIDQDSIDLNIYLKDNSTGDIIKLTDQSFVHEGNTIQLVYSVLKDNSKDKYGVIFSIDGRSAVTMHYPHTSWQSTLLDCGRAVPLDEAFTLDDAPNYEIFFFVAASSPIDVENILTTAKQLAVKVNKKPDEALKLGAAAFSKYQVETFTLFKE